VNSREIGDFAQIVNPVSADRKIRSAMRVSVRRRVSPPVSKISLDIASGSTGSRHDFVVTPKILAVKPID